MAASTASAPILVLASQQVIVLLDNHSGRTEDLANLRRGLLRVLHGPAPAAPVVAAVPARPVALTATTLTRYVGVYELTPAFRITVRQRDGRIFVQATGQSEFETEATSSVLFTLKVVPAQVEFTKNDKGEVAQLILHQGGRSQPAAKVE